MGKGDEKQTSRHFKWLRRLLNRLRFRHSKFKDGKYTKGSRDIEKWPDDSDLTSADYPDYRWQVVTKGTWIFTGIEPATLELCCGEGGLCPGGLYQGDLCLGGLCEERAVCILLQC